MLIFESNMAPLAECKNGAFELNIKAKEKMTGTSADVLVAIELKNCSSINVSLPKDREEHNTLTGLLFT